MRFLLQRRWLQFRLSTWFVLVAILGWACASPLYVIDHMQVSTMVFTPVPLPTGLEPLEIKSIKDYPDVPPGGMAQYDVSFRRFNRLGIAPYLVLAAFLAWKAAWAIRSRLVRRCDPRAAE
ncbi:MAG: hypothetical protein AB7O68_16630 [Pirellulales bacterium]